MINIKHNETNRIVSILEPSTANPYYIFDFIDIYNREVIFSLKNISPSNKYKEFLFNDGSENRLYASGNVKIYESTYDASVIDSSMLLIREEPYKYIIERQADISYDVCINVTEYVWEPCDGTYASDFVYNPIWLTGDIPAQGIPAARINQDASHRFVSDAFLSDPGLGKYIKEASLNESYFKWDSGFLEPSVASGTGDVTKEYVDGSIANFSTNASVNIAISSAFLTNSSLGNISLLTYTHNTSIGLIDSSILFIFNKNNEQDASITRIDASLSNVESYDIVEASTYFYTITQIDASFATKYAGFTVSTSTSYLVNVSDNLGIIDVSGTVTVILPNSLNTGFQTTVVNTGLGTITLNASILYTTDSSVKLTDRYAAASAVHKGNGIWYAFGNLR